MKSLLDQIQPASHMLGSPSDTITLQFDENLKSINRFVSWLDKYGELSLDFQTFYASRLGQNAKALYYRKPLLGTLAVAPIIFCEAFVPAARRLFWKPERFPIADAHYAMGFLFLAKTLEDERYYRRAVHF